MDINDAMIRYPWLKDILHELPEEMLELIKIKTYKTQDVIIEHCEESYYTYIILEGICCSSQDMKNGTRFILRKATVGDVVGFMNVYGKNRDFSAQILARTKVIAARLPRTLMQACFGTYPDFSTTMSYRVIDRLQSFLSLISECNNYPSYLSLITYLEYNYLFYLRSYPDQFTGPVRIMESRQNISDFLGIDVRSVQRLLARIKEEQLVTIPSRSIYINQAQYQALRKIRYDWMP